MENFKSRERRASRPRGATPSRRRPPKARRPTHFPPEQEQFIDWFVRYWRGRKPEEEDRHAER